MAVKNKCFNLMDYKVDLFLKVKKQLNICNFFRNWFWMCFWLLSFKFRDRCLSSNCFFSLERNGLQLKISIIQTLIKYGLKLLLVLPKNSFSVYVFTRCLSLTLFYPCKKLLSGWVNLFITHKAKLIFCSDTLSTNKVIWLQPRC